MSTIHNLSGYGPKNAPEQTREPKINLSFAHKLPKADLKDVPGMKLYLDVLTQVLPAVSMPAAAALPYADASARAQNAAA